MLRSPQEIAARAIVFGTLGFRASLEMTVHERCASLCAQLLPWLEQQNLGGQINNYHREILGTPYRELSQKDQTEAYWRGEAASLLGWAIQWFDQLHLTTTVDASELIRRLKILQPDLNDLVENARFRPKSAVHGYCAFCLLVRLHFQLPLLTRDGQEVLNRIRQATFAELGLDQSCLQDLDDLDMEAAQLVHSTPSAQGLYVVRAMTSEWLLGKDDSYCDRDGSDADWHRPVE